MARFVTLQQAMQAMKQIRSSVNKHREDSLLSNDGFIFNTPSQVQAEYERNVEEFMTGDEDDLTF